jgi:hypothetical protein
MTRFLAVFCPVLSLIVMWGCATHTKPPGIAVAISSPAAPPSAEQLATINRLLQEQVAKTGFVFATNARSADYLMHVRFTPDAANPPRGHLEFIGIERAQPSNSRPVESSAVEASESTLRELRRIIAEVDALNARSN